MTPKYCSKCGRELKWKQDDAQKHLNYYLKRFEKYNAETGKQQIVGWFECPKSRWWNNHDSYVPRLV